MAMSRDFSTKDISHLMRVTAILIEQGGTENEASAALLHDAVEDQGGIHTSMVNKP